MRGCAATRWNLTLSVVLIVPLGICSNAWAQAGTATLTGTVKDAQGSVVPGATVTAAQPATGSTRNTTTNVQGVFTFPGLTPGTYNVKVELAGFKTYVREQVALQVD